MKFFSFAAIALTCFLTTVSAKIELAAPSNPVSGGRSTVTWTHDASDPAQFILMLQLASDSWATGQFWEFTQTKANKLDVTFLNTYPYVISTKSIYRLTARNQSNVDQIYARSPDFRFLPPGSTATTSSTTVSTTSTRSTTSIKSTTASTTTSKPSAITTSTASTLISMTPLSTPTRATQPITSTPPAVQPTTTTDSAPAQTTDTTGGDPAGETGGVLGNNNNNAALRAGLSVSGGAAVVAVLAVSLGSSFVYF